METELTTIQRILNHLSIAVHGTEQEYYNEQELQEFAKAFQNKWQDSMSDEDVATYTFCSF